jgi:hypothetical protein
MRRYCREVDRRWRWLRRPHQPRRAAATRLIRVGCRVYFDPDGRG